MNQDLEYWRATQFVMLLNLIGLSNRKTFEFVKRLKDVHDFMHGFENFDELPCRLSGNTNSGINVFFRARGSDGQCEICEIVIPKQLFNIHLKREHNLEINYF